MLNDQETAIPRKFFEELWTWKRHSLMICPDGKLRNPWILDDPARLFFAVLIRTCSLAIHHLWNEGK